jgi:hypothetical protein
MIAGPMFSKFMTEIAPGYGTEPFPEPPSNLLYGSPQFQPQPNNPQQPNNQPPNNPQPPTDTGNNSGDSGNNSGNGNGNGNGNQRNG